MTKSELKALFVNGHLVTAEDMANLIDSLKAMQTAVSDPTASGRSVTFIATISQDSEGRITATKKTIDTTGLLTQRDLQTYQSRDLQKVVNITLTGTGEPLEFPVEHSMGHYPTVRILDTEGYEVSSMTYELELWKVRHESVNSVVVQIFEQMNTDYSGNFKLVFD